MVYYCEVCQRQVEWERPSNPDRAPNSRSEQEQRLPEAIVLPECSGSPHEDLEFFINICYHEFKAGRVPNKQWMLKAHDQLKGAALTFMNWYGKFVTTWDQFAACLNNKFAGEDVLIALCKEYCMHKRQKQEETEIFVRRKVQMYS
ncbi:hypothetical protein PR048_021895 [Dryococelus australis]|uniref:Retrotransposon gag domain-containing protein n=1 Tax=Dryococelus australis TaxID=614101 RepID=A0ABQ9GZH1_9NEOP|nr:hypothetical protein PR048_021895 [Dryococelus australis]